MIIGVIGHGASGASALVDILKEFDELKMSKLEREFPIAYAPDGLLDLEYHLVNQPVRYYSSDIAIYRFLEYVKKEQKYNIHFSKNTNGQFQRISEKYIEKLTQIKWRGYWYFDYYFHSLLYDKVIFALGHRIDQKIKKLTTIRISKRRFMHLSVQPDNFYEASREYIRDILKAMGLDLNEKILLDQPFPYNDPESCFKFFDDPVAIVLNRDPRDVYVFFKEYISETESWLACDSVEDFINYYKLIRKKKYVDSDRIITLQYEDLVFHYDDIRNKLVKLLKIKNTCENRRNLFFKPEISIGNVQIYKRFPELDNDIKKIEDELGDYLYPYPNEFAGMDISKGEIILYTKSQKKK